MAFKPVTMDDSAVCVSPFDPAVDEEHTDWKKYGETWLKGEWRQHVKARDGERLTEFVIGVVPADEMARIADECRASDGGAFREEEARWRCFCWGLRDVKGWPVEVPKVKRGAVEYVDPKWIRETFVRGLRKVALTVGASIWLFNQLTEDEVKN